ncbi:MAG: class I SAM-dependent methyltransferase [Ectobacillus sp.]
MKELQFIALAAELASLLEEANIPYQFVDAASLRMQGVEIDVNILSIHIQWDVLEKAYELFQPYSPSSIKRNATKAGFRFYNGEIDVQISCYFNMTVRTDPYRIMVNYEGTAFWCRSLYAYLYFPGEEQYQELIHQALITEQQKLTKQNELAWNQSNYTALLNRYGEPEGIAEKIKQNPGWRLHPFGKYMKDATGKRVIHLMGSNGIKAVALSLLGADVTVADFSRENAAFAVEVAGYADVSINYIISDVLSLLDKTEAASYDIVLMELGVLHYFIDLKPLLQIVKQLLCQGGRFILHEFHPISTKLITSSGKKHKVTGNYFSPAIERGEVAFAKHMPDKEKEELTKVVQRKWTMGELITAVAQEGLMIRILEEEPNHKLHDIGLPKTFTLVAEKL